MAAGCHRRLKMALAEREELRRVGRENERYSWRRWHVLAAFNFEFDDIDVDVPLGELLVEASKETPLARDVDPRCLGRRVRLSQPTPGCGDGHLVQPRCLATPGLEGHAGTRLHSWGGGRGIGDQRSRIPELRANRQ